MPNDNDRKVQRAFRKTFFMIAAKLGTKKTMEICDALPPKEFIDLTEYLTEEIPDASKIAS